MDQLEAYAKIIGAPLKELMVKDNENNINDAISEYKNNMMQRFSERDKSICASLARQMSVRQGTTLKAEEMQQLIADLFSCQAPNISPSGRRTMFIVSDNDIADGLKG